MANYIISLPIGLLTHLFIDKFYDIVLHDRKKNAPNNNNNNNCYASNDNTIEKIIFITIISLILIFISSYIIYSTDDNSFKTLGLGMAIGSVALIISKYYFYWNNFSEPSKLMLLGLTLACLSSGSLVFGKIY